MNELAKISAKDVASAVLEVIGDAVVQGDFATFSSMFVTPLKMATLAGTVQIDNNDQLQKFFEKRHAALRASNITGMTRRCIEAKLVDSNLINAAHVGHFTKNGQPVTEPNPIYTTIAKIDGHWKIIGNECATAPGSQWPGDKE